MKKGFTLLECIVLVAVVTVILGSMYLVKKVREKNLGTPVEELTLFDVLTNSEIELTAKDRKKVKEEYRQIRFVGPPIELTVVVEKDALDLSDPDWVVVKFKPGSAVESIGVPSPTCLIEEYFYED